MSEQLTGKVDWKARALRAEAALGLQPQAGRIAVAFGVKYGEQSLFLMDQVPIDAMSNRERVIRMFADHMARQMAQALEQQGVVE